MKKKLLVLGAVILAVFAFCFITIHVKSEEQIPLYSWDGRTHYFKASEVEAQCTVGWYKEPVQLLYTADGRCKLFKQTEVEAQCTVGWYTDPVQTLYAADGRSAVFKKTEIETQCTVGWYTSREEAAKSRVRASDISDLANVMHSEANGLTTREVAMVAWCVLNRVDIGQGTIHSICNSNQFTRKGNRTQYAWLAEDVLIRYYSEKMGVENVGRVLPKDYLYFTGDGRHNYFRNSFYGSKVLYFPELINPYE